MRMDSKTIHSHAEEEGGGAAARFKLLNEATDFRR